jgi:thymidylate synthase ThyX
MDIGSLKHVRRKLKSGGQVIVVDTGAVLNAEALAMVQALHSRSLGGFDEHMEIVARKGPEKFMRDFYCGFGHKSVGDGGDAVVILEGVSMLVPKAVQDWPLYNGTEGSTRFMDFSKQKFMNPLSSEDGQQIQEDWRTAYLHGLGWLKVGLKSRFPINEGEDKKVYEKAINARACDIMRSFLPAGTQTKLSWKMTLRQFDDELLWLRHHPLEEVREVAEATEDALSEAYPNSFLKKKYEETEKYAELVASDCYFKWPHVGIDFSVVNDSISRSLLGSYEPYLKNRPPKTELPKKIRECGMLMFLFMLDFGSFRDIQRHRAVVQKMPLLTTNFGFHPWYLEELGEGLRGEMKSFIANQTTKINSLKTAPELRQYYTAMGFNMQNCLSGDLHALVYLVELRGTRFVHPTLQQRALQIAEKLREKFADYGLVLHMDPEPGRFDIRRGTHDIVVKE